VRREFKTSYGLATQRIATDGIDIFVSYADGDLVRAHDGQAPIRDIINEHLRYITWDEVDGSPMRLTLQQYPDIAPVVIDPRFGWGRRGSRLRRKQRCLAGLGRSPVRQLPKRRTTQRRTNHRPVRHREPPFSSRPP
jgi:hypothetical protein